MSKYVNGVGAAVLSALTVSACERTPDAPMPDGPAPPAKESTDAEGDDREEEAVNDGGSGDPSEIPGEAAAGEAFYEAHMCGSCHGNDDDIFAPPTIRGADATSLLAWMDGTTPHSGGTVDGITAEDAANLAAFLAKQE